MKKIIVYIGSAVFAALMVYNIGAGNLLAKNTDVSLESIKIMAAGAFIEDNNNQCTYPWQFYYCYTYADGIKRCAYSTDVDYKGTCI
jgi:hypothetical protein